MNRFCFLFLFVATAITAQQVPTIAKQYRDPGTNVLNELEKIHKAFADNAMWVKIQIKGYKSEADKKGFDVGSGEFKSLPGKGYYSVFGDEICVSNQSRTLYIDKGNKIIGVSELGLKDVKQAVDIEKLKTGIKMADTVILVKTENTGIAKLLIHMNGSQSPSTELWYNTKDYSINRIIYHYSDDDGADYGATKLCIYYSYSDVSSLKENAFETGQFVQKKISGEYVSAGEFKSYKAYRLPEKR